MYRAPERKRTGRNLALALALLTGVAASMPVAAKTVEPEAAAEGILADYTVYIGGLIVAEGSMKASLKDESYRMQNQLGSAGLPKKFWDAKWSMTSEGRVEGDKLRPSSFAFTSTENDETKKRLLTYNNGGMPTLSFDPPLPPEERESTLPFERQGTLDPVSTFLVPVVAGGNPCNRKLPVFDGKRRYDLDLTFDSVGEITTRDNGYSGEAIRCKVRVTPRAGMEKTKLTNNRQLRNDTWIWLALADNGRFYFPVRVQMRTPIGGAVLDVVRLRPLVVNTAATANLPSN